MPHQIWDKSPAASISERVSRLVAEVETLGAAFYPNEASFPLPYLTFRLEQVRMTMTVGVSHVSEYLSLQVHMHHS